ncbi:MAG: hypothetical protein J6K81_03630 [Rikenellaceae bacterium]|nr:hypothetical protein [Rikenellaceae bacterium]
MKRLILLLCVCVYSIGRAQNIQQNWYIPATVGTTLKYAVYNQEGEITGYSIVHTDSVTQLAEGCWRVTQSSVQYNANNRQVGDTLYAETVISGDTTYVGINRTMQMARAEVQTRGTLIALPSTIDRYTQFPNRTLDCTVRIAGLRFNTTTEAYDYQLMNDETLTVDNRIYNALKFSYNTTTKVAGRTEQTFVTTWFAKGVGTMLAVVNNEQTGESNTTKLISIHYPEQ